MTQALRNRLSRIVPWVASLWLFVVSAFAQHTHASQPSQGGAEVTAFPTPSAEYRQDTSVPWMTTYFPSGTEERVQPVLAEMEAFRTSLRAALGPNVLQKVSVRIARSPEDMAALAPEKHKPQSYATAVSYMGAHTVLVSLRAPTTHQGTDLSETLKHELVHVAVDDAFGPGRVPTWFNEGMAIWYSGEGSLTRRQTLLDASSMRRLIPLPELDPQFADGAPNVALAYAEAGDFIRFLRKDPTRFQSLVTRAQSGQSFDRALGDAYATDLRTLDYQWKSEVEKVTDWMPGILTGSFMWGVGAIILILGYVRRKFSDRKVRARWDDEETALAKARAEVFTHEDEVLPIHIPGVPRIEHDGNWHTLH